MEQYAIKGGNPLVGEVEIGGAKNAALPIIAAALMSEETVHIDNLPDVRDTNVLLEAMQSIGVMIKREDRHRVTIYPSRINNLVVDGEGVRRIRASYYLSEHCLHVTKSRSSASGWLRYRLQSHRPAYQGLPRAWCGRQH